MRRIYNWAIAIIASLITVLALSQAQAGNNLDRGDWLTEKPTFSDNATPSDVGNRDELSDLRGYLEAEEVLYVLRESHPRGLTIYFDYGEEGRKVNTNWSCKKMNKAFPGINLKSLVFVDVNNVALGKTFFDC
jgi:hypothetical protein